MTQTVVGDAVVITVIGLAIVARVCRAQCHARIDLPFPISGRHIMAAWDDAERQGWSVVDPSNTLLVDQANGIQTHELARPGVSTTFDECEAQRN